MSKKRVHEEPTQPSPSLINFYDMINPDEIDMPEYRNPNAHIVGIKHPMMGIIVGATGTGPKTESGGKTNLLLNLIYQMRCWDRIIVFCRNPKEPLYQLLKKMGGESVQVTNELDELPEIEDMPSGEQVLYVFDDLVSQPKNIQNRIWEYFLRARKGAGGNGSSGSCIYITQDHTSCPKHIRDNATHLFLKNLSKSRDLGVILSDFKIGHDARLLKHLAQLSQRDGSCMTIDIHEPDWNRKFRDGFSNCYQLAHLLSDD